MESAASKELEDSVFGTDSPLDWAEEVNMAEELNELSYDKYDEGVGAMTTSPKATGRRDSARDQRRGSERQSNSNQSGRQSRGSSDHLGRRGRGGRSSSRTGYAQGAMPAGAARGPRDRSASMERAGMERAGSRGWRRSGAQRADAADRWEHDRFDAQSTRSRERRNSAQPMDIQHIGKQGISHVTISRRDSSTLAASYDAPRRPPVLQPRSPRSPPGSGFQSYRAPHRRQGSGDHCAERDPKAVEDTEGSSAEIEWENFVANGGLELPFDRITDELLVKQPRPAQPKLSYHAEGTPARRRRPADDLQDAGAARLNGDGDAADKAGRSSRGANPSSLKAQKGIAIRGAAKTPESFGAAIDQVAAPQARRPSATPAKPPKPAADPVGIRIKGTTPVPNGARADAQPPAKPTGPSSRPSTPTKPSTPPRATLSRPSSNEGRSTMPSTYLRRQFEGYDEDRGRHIFSVNIPYDDNRYAPIHVHEKDDLARLAAKFARTWRLHNKELRIKLLLVKMKSALLDCSI